MRLKKFRVTLFCIAMIFYFMPISLPSAHASISSVSPYYGHLYAQPLFTNEYYDVDSDGLSEYNNSVIENMILTASEDASIGMIATGEYAHPYGRLTSLGYSVSLIPPDSGFEVFMDFQVVYLPTSWAQVGTGSYEIIEEHAEDYIAYFESGGGLFVDQPNPYMQPDSMVTPTLLPYPITFYNQYNDNDYPPVIVNPEHPITEGLSEEEMPFPADQMVLIDEHYEVLVRGRDTGSASLVVLSYGEGRVLIQTANPSLLAIHPFSNELYMRMVNWVQLGLQGPSKELHIDLWEQAIAYRGEHATTSFEIDSGTEVISGELNITAYNADPIYLRAISFHLGDDGGYIGTYYIGPGQVRGEGTIGPLQTKSWVYDLSQAMIADIDSPEGYRFVDFVGIINNLTQLSNPIEVEAWVSTFTSTAWISASLDLVVLENGIEPDIRTPIDPIDFGDVLVGSSVDETATIYNDGTATLIINDITRTSVSDEFTYIGPATPFDIVAGSSQAITINFAPVSAGIKSANFNISSNDPDEADVTFDVSGNGIALATIDFAPDTLNMKNKGQFVTVYIELLEGYDVKDIDVSTVFLNDVIPAMPKPVEIGDYNENGISELMVKFDRTDVQNILQPGDEIEVMVTGHLEGNMLFKGTDTIRVIDKGKEVKTRVRLLRDLNKMQ